MTSTLREITPGLQEAEKPAASGTVKLVERRQNSRLPVPPRRGVLLLKWGR